MLKSAEMLKPSSVAFFFPFVHLLTLLIIGIPRYLYFCSPDPTSQFRLAIGSYVEQYSNAVHIVKKVPGMTDDLESQLYKACEFDHPYPCTKILWSPDVSATKDLLATTGDYLRVWSVTDDGSGNLTPKKVALLNNVRIVLLMCCCCEEKEWNTYAHLTCRLGFFARRTRRVNIVLH